MTFRDEIVTPRDEIVTSRDKVVTSSDEIVTSRRFSATNYHFVMIFDQNLCKYVRRLDSLHQCV